MLSSTCRILMWVFPPEFTSCHANRMVFSNTSCTSDSFRDSSLERKIMFLFLPCWLRLLAVEGADFSGGSGPAAGPRVGSLPHDGHRPTARHSHRLPTAPTPNHSATSPTCPSASSQAASGTATGPGRAPGSGRNTRAGPGPGRGGAALRGRQTEWGWWKMDKRLTAWSTSSWIPATLSTSPTLPVPRHVCVGFFFFF